MTARTTQSRPGAGGVGIRVSRAYESSGAADGYRVLVDRLWPRGVTKADAGLDEWAREVAPSDGLRRWYRHDPDRFEEFARRYQAELAEPAASEDVALLVERARAGPLVLVTATRDVEHSGARVLQDHLRDKGRHARRRRPASAGLDGHLA